MVVELDEHTRRHVMMALDRHARWCRESGYRLPEGVKALALTLAASNGQGCPEVEPAAEAVEGDRVLLDYEAAGVALSVSTRTVRRLVAAGRLKPRRVGRRVLVARSELERFASEAT